MLTTDSDVYRVSKRLEELLVDFVRSSVERVYGLRVLKSGISPPNRAVFYDFYFELEDGSVVKVDLKSAYKAQKSLAPATVQAMLKRARQQVDLVGMWTL
jgi:hypothetical protein